jgi:hypothetical protein
MQMRTRHESLDPARSDRLARALDDGAKRLGDDVVDHYLNYARTEQRLSDQTVTCYGGRLFERGDVAVSVVNPATEETIAGTGRGRGRGDRRGRRAGSGGFAWRGAAVAPARMPRRLAGLVEEHAEEPHCSRRGTSAAI